MNIEIEEPKIGVRSKWFDELIGEIKSHEVQLETGVASKELEEHYDMLMRGNSDEMAVHGKAMAQKHFVTSILRKYLKVLFVKENLPITLNQLAFSFNDSEILSWIEIPDDREDIEHKLILAEAKINAEFYARGYTMNSTIVEASDELAIPAHYLSVLDQPVNL